MSFEFVESFRADTILHEKIVEGAKKENRKKAEYLRILMDKLFGVKRE